MYLDNENIVIFTLFLKVMFQDSAEREFWMANTNWMFSHVFKVNIEQLIFNQGYQPER